MKTYLRLSHDVIDLHTGEHTMGLIPTDQDGMDYLMRRKHNDILHCEIKKAKSYEFLSKGMKLVRTVFNAMPEPQIQMVDGRIVNPIWDFEHLRSELTIMAGEYQYYAMPDGSLKIEAKSWADMDQAEFASFYNRLIDACLKILPDTWDADELERVSNEIVRFA